MTSVLFCRSNTVIDLGILNVLRAAPRLILIQVAAESLTQLVSLVGLHHPEVVVVCQGTLIGQHALWGTLLAMMPTIRLFTICLESNDVWINQKQITKIQRATDIIDLIDNKPYPFLEEREKGCP